MANSFRLGSVVAAAVVATLCGSGDAFVGGGAVRVASRRTANAAMSVRTKIWMCLYLWSSFFPCRVVRAMGVDVCNMSRCCSHGESQFSGIMCTVHLHMHVRLCGDYHVTTLFDTKVRGRCYLVPAITRCGSPILRILGKIELGGVASLLKFPLSRSLFLTACTCGNPHPVVVPWTRQF